MHEIHQLKRKFVFIVTACVAGTCAVLAGAPKPADPNNITGTHGLILIDKLGSRIRFCHTGHLQRTVRTST